MTPTATSVLSDGTITRLVEEGRIKIDPWDPALVQPASVDLRLGDTFRVFHNHRVTSIDLRQPPENLTEEVKVADGDSFVIHPGEFCLGLAGALMAQEGVWALAADTDGIDGVEDNAGAFVTPDTLARAEAAGKKLSDHLDRNDAYGYFDAISDLLVTGPTHTNVNDFRAILIL